MRKTWTTTYNSPTTDGIMEFQGPRIVAHNVVSAEKAAFELGVSLSDLYTRPPLFIRIRIAIRKLLNKNKYRSALFVRT